MGVTPGGSPGIARSRGHFRRIPFHCNTGYCIIHRVSYRQFAQGVYAMMLNYYPETDSLYIDLSPNPSVESRTISDGVVVDYDEAGNLVGIDIDNASRKIDLRQITITKIPAQQHTITA